MSATFEHETFIPATRAQIWARVTSPAGINHELMPLMRMTVPPGLAGKSIDELPVGETIGRSFILLFGLVPIDYDDICIVEHDPGRRFLERSTMASMATWEHERTLTPREGGCVVHDRIAFRLRWPLAFVPGAHRLLGLVLARVFAHRHRRLLRWFQGADARAATALS